MGPARAQTFCVKPAEQEQQKKSFMKNILYEKTCEFSKVGPGPAPGPGPGALKGPLIGSGDRAQGPGPGALKGYIRNLIYFL